MRVGPRARHKDTILGCEWISKFGPHPRNPALVLAGGTPSWTTLRFCVAMQYVEHMSKYTSTFSRLLLFLTFLLNLVTLGNDFTDFLWSSGNRLKTQGFIIQPEIMDSSSVCLNSPVDLCPNSNALSIASFVVWPTQGQPFILCYHLD